MKGKIELINILKELDIDYKGHSHPPLNSVEDAKLYAKNVGGLHCKNLLLEDAIGKFYLLIMPDQKRIELKKLSEQIKSKRLSFVSHQILEDFIGVKPKCITPFALINDSKKQISVVLDRDVLDGDEVSFHPMINTETFTIKSKDFIKFIDYCGQEKIVITI